MFWLPDRMAPSEVFGWIAAIVTAIAVTVTIPDDPPPIWSAGGTPRVVVEEASR